jgi:Fe-S-cluster-containing dehydrogenase component/anaerobic selenocysteine-containing dehydrogenase
MDGDLIPRREDEAAEPFSLAELPPISRKRFLALLSASMAFAAAGCSNYRNKGEIVPYTKKPEEITPGVANYYASTCNACAQSCGILIKTREGRPIKLDGNPDHPINRGKLCATGQASILNLYDPYRLRAPQPGGGAASAENLAWEDAGGKVLERLADAVSRRKEIAVIARDIHSPTAKKVLEDFQRAYPGTAIYSYALINSAVRERAWEDCYGRQELPVIEWENAAVILALESDFLGTDGMTVEQTGKFATRRNVEKPKEFNRLYCVEGAMSLTGANADYRLRLRPDLQLEFVLALMNELFVVRRAGPLASEISPQVAATSLGGFATRNGLDKSVLGQLADDLLAHRGAALVHAGDVLPEPVHIAVNYLNDILGNTALFSRRQSAVTVLPLTPPDVFDALLGRMRRGEVGVVLHFGSNPAYHLPAEFRYGEALKKVPFSVSLAEAIDETAQLCTLVLPIHTMFESWGDTQVRTGVLSLQQPVIAPLYDSRQKEAVLLSWIQGKGSASETIYHQYLMDRWQKEVYPALHRRADFLSFWYASLHDGVVEFDETQGARGGGFRSAALRSVPVPAEQSGFTLALVPGYFIGDGTLANSGWLQELPHPVSKIVWDNYAAVSPGTAKQLGLDTNDRVELKLPHGTLVLPVFLQPGQADGMFSVSLGYGRWNAGPVGTDVGFNAGALLSKESLGASRVFTGASAVKAAGRYTLVATQEHHRLDDPFVKDFHLKRKVIQEGTLPQYERDPRFLHHEEKELFNIAPTVEYKGVKWAMAIDLNKCTGCNACVAGCNVENNIPVVGKDQIARGRAMHWIRVDRYYAGTPDAPVPSHQPMLCQHCDNAPCENVCPVAATTHSPDGLNQMVYNRCVGTRYCSNNCPYKVRHFNFYNWRDFFAAGYYEEESVNLLHNPEVTVRSRGVMEKCTFCIQRIMEARQHAAEQKRELRGHDVRTACEEACPATAIVFGDMNDPNSEVARQRAHNLGYHVLEELNARPNVTYLARLRNINAEGNT